MVGSYFNYKIIVTSVYAYNVVKKRGKGGKKGKKREECADDTFVTCFTMDDEKPSGILPLSSYAQKKE